MPEEPDPVRLRHTSRSGRHQLFGPPRCPQCSTYLETAATKDNPAAEIRPLTMARCGACMVLHVLDEDSQPREHLTCDETSFNAAMTANPEIHQWSLATLRRRRSLFALEMQARCAAPAEWLRSRSGPNRDHYLRTVEAYAASFDENGYTSAPPQVRRDAWHLFETMRKAKQARPGTAES
jgi:hypothetical protein